MSPFLYFARIQSTTVDAPSFCTISCIACLIWGKSSGWTKLTADLPRISSGL